MQEYLKSIGPKSRRVPSKSTTKRKAPNPVEPTNGQKKKATTNGRKKKAAKQHGTTTNVAPAPPSHGNEKSPPPELGQKLPANMRDAMDVPASEPSPKPSKEVTESTSPNGMDIDAKLANWDNQLEEEMDEAATAKSAPLAGGAPTSDRGGPSSNVSRSKGQKQQYR